jgi:elongator complex protein 1
LQAELSDFEDELGKALQEVWTKPTEDDVPPADSWATRMEERERDKAVNPMNKVPKPELPRGENWRIILYELDQE